MSCCIVRNSVPYATFFSVLTFCDSSETIEVGGIEIFESDGVGGFGTDGMLGGPPAYKAGAFKIGESDCLVGKPTGGCGTSTIAFLFYHIYFFCAIFSPRLRTKLQNIFCLLATSAIYDRNYFFRLVRSLREKFFLLELQILPRHEFVVLLSKHLHSTRCSCC